MNLTDLQIELRLIEEHIVTLHSEIEKMKPQPEEKKKADFEQITKLSEKNPIERISIKNAPVQIKKVFFSSLSYIILQEESEFYNRILYLCRLAKGCEFDTTAEDLYKLGLEFEMKDLNNLCQEILNYKYTYLIEMLIIANISEKASESIFAIVTDFSSAFEISKEELRVLGMMAKGVLINNRDIILEMPIPSKSMWSGELNDYLNKTWFEQHRVDCGLLCTKEYSKKEYSWYYQRYFNFENNADYKEEIPCAIKKRIEAGTIVKKGDTICTYSKKTPKKNNNTSGGIRLSAIESSQEYDVIENTIEAPCDGMVFFIKDKKKSKIKDKMDEYIAIYVVSYFDDYSDFSDWYIKKGDLAKK